MRDLAYGMARVTLAERVTDGRLICPKFLHSSTDQRLLEQECRALFEYDSVGYFSRMKFKPGWEIFDAICDLYMTAVTHFPKVVDLNRRGS